MLHAPVGAIGVHPSCFTVFCGLFAAFLSCGAEGSCSKERYPLGIIVFGPGAEAVAAAARAFPCIEERDELVNRSKMDPRRL